MSMKSKKQSRFRRSRRTSVRLKNSADYRLCVNRTASHIYAQIIVDKVGESSKTLASASSLEKALTEELKGTKSDKAKVIGKYIAKRAIEAGVNVKKVGFDRRGFKYHGRVKVLADAAREHGLEF